MTISAAGLWLLGVIGTGFVGMVGWVAVRIIGRLDKLTDLLQSDIRDLLHQYDLRITRLEAWRDNKEV